MFLVMKLTIIFFNVKMETHSCVCLCETETNRVLMRLCSSSQSRLNPVPNSVGIFIVGFHPNAHVIWHLINFLHTHSQSTLKIGPLS